VCKSPNGESQLKYHAYIDGLRAIAVLAVLFFHADLGFHGGYVGVDVFFVISGYLITGLILKDLDREQFHILTFWERRVRRILPAVAVVLVSCLAAGWFLFLPQGFKELGESASAQAALVSNIYFWVKSWIGSGYFAPSAEVKPLLHTWSLSVEEQFYLLFPFLLIAFKRFSRKSLIPGILLLCSFSFSLSVCCSYLYPLANFYFLPTRAWELLLGAFLAAIPTQRASTRWLNEFLSVAGLLAILYAAFFYGRDTRFPGVAALFPCVGTALIIWANGRTLTGVGKLLATPPIVFVGLISYSLYLWHWPILVFVKYWSLDPLSQSQRMLLLLSSVIPATLSWRFVEIPFRKRTIFKRRVQMFSFACVTTAMLLLTGLVVFEFKGLPSRIPAAALAYASGNTDRTFLNDLSVKQALAGHFVEIGRGDTHLQIDLLVWGDSFAMAVMPVFDVLCKEHSVRGVAATHVATAPLIGYECKDKYSLKEGSIAFNSAVVDFVHRKRVGNVVLAANWGGYRESARLRHCLFETMDALKDTSARIWIMRSVPRQRWNVPSALALTVLHGNSPEELGCTLAEHRNEFRRQDPMFEGLATKYPNVTFMDPTYLFVNASGRCRVAKGGKALYCDEEHLTVAGAMLLKPLFDPIFASIDTNATRVRDKDVTR